MSVPEAEQRLGVSERQIHRYLSGECSAPKLVGEKVREIAAARSAGRPEPAFRFIDLFAGIGGLRLGFEAIGGRCVFTSEWDRFAQKTYLRNFADGEDHVMVGDIHPYSAAPSKIRCFARRLPLSAVLPGRGLQEELTRPAAWV